MSEEIKRQLIKALAYGMNREQIKEAMSVSDEDINSVKSEELESEKAYYKEMGYIL